MPYIFHQKAIHFSRPLLKGVLIKRYKRFLMDAALESPWTSPKTGLTQKIVTAHCANTGPITGLTTPGTQIALAPILEGKGKLEFVWMMAKEKDYPSTTPQAMDQPFPKQERATSENWVGVHTQMPNLLVRHALKEKVFPFLPPLETIKAEVPLFPIPGYAAFSQAQEPKSRLDFCMTPTFGPLIYMEVKNVHMKRGEKACFPDTVTLRGARHLQDLIILKRLGYEAIMLYVIQRDDVQGFSIADDIDPVYAQGVKEALAAGVKFYAWCCHVCPETISLSPQGPFCPF